MSKERISWDEYFIRFAYLAAERTNCLSRKVGTVFVRDNHILATGYNGAPSGVIHCGNLMPHCKCIRKAKNIPSGERQELCRGLHAEQNAIIQAAKTGTNIDGATVYCTTFPCSTCAKMLINVGVKKIYYVEEYLNEMATHMFRQAGIPYVRLTKDGVEQLDYANDEGN